jgi:hypothetical protein
VETVAGRARWWRILGDLYPRNHSSGNRLLHWASTPYPSLPPGLCP